VQVCKSSVCKFWSCVKASTSASASHAIPRPALTAPAGGCRLESQNPVRFSADPGRRSSYGARQRQLWLRRRGHKSLIPSLNSVCEKRHGSFYLFCCSMNNNDEIQRQTNAGRIPSFGVLSPSQPRLVPSRAVAVPVPGSARINQPCSWGSCNADAVDADADANAGWSRQQKDNQPMMHMVFCHRCIPMRSSSLATTHTNKYMDSFHTEIWIWSINSQSSNGSADIIPHQETDAEADAIPIKRQRLKHIMYPSFWTAMHLPSSVPTQPQWMDGWMDGGQ